MNEFELITRLTAALPTHSSVIAGVGDDCAVLDLGHPDKWFLLKTDAVVEDVHFDAACPPEKIGRKAMNRCLSDIAAMAGTPTHALVTLGLPRAFSPDFARSLYDGLRAAAAAHSVVIVGGETTATPHACFLSISLLGEIPRGRAVMRSGAKAGDAIFVSGELGGSRLGKHLDFEPRLVEARWLAASFNVHAMIDLSDGLAGDLRHILQASGVGAELSAEAIPVSAAAKKQGQGAKDESRGEGRGARGEGQGTGSKTPLEAALTDGEDFELLFTVAAADAVPLLDAWKKRFSSLRLSCIGKITSKAGVRLRDKRSAQPMEAYGYDHFA